MTLSLSLLSLSSLSPQHIHILCSSMQFNFSFVCSPTVVENASSIHGILKTLVETIENKYRDEILKTGFPICEPSNKDLIGLKTIIDNYALLGYFHQWDWDTDRKYVLTACYLIASYALDSRIPEVIKYKFARDSSLAKGTAEQVKGPFLAKYNRLTEY
jgi:hypothetical protein